MERLERWILRMIWAMAACMAIGAPWVLAVALSRGLGGHVPDELWLLGLYWLLPASVFVAVAAVLVAAYAVAWIVRRLRSPGEQPPDRQGANRGDDQLR